MSHTQGNGEAIEPAVKGAWWEKWLFLALIIFFPSGMIYLNANGTDTSAAFQKVLGVIMIGSVVIGLGALIIAVIARVGALLFGKGK